MKILTKISTLVFNLVYYIVILLVVSLAFLLAVSAVPVTGNYKVKIVQSGSMEPAIKTGSIVIIKPVNSYVIGDVITFGKDTIKDIPTTHRIIESRLQSGLYFYKVKGDANNAPDVVEVSEKNIIGKVLVDIPYLGFLLDMAKKPVGFVFLVVLPAGFIIVDEFKNIWVEVKKRRQEKKLSQVVSDGISDSSL